MNLFSSTKQEVLSGKGFDTCGNKHCISYFTPTIITDDKVDSFLTKKKNGDRIATEEIIRWSKNSLNRTLLNDYYERSNHPSLTTHQSLNQQIKSNNIEDKNTEKERHIPRLSDEERLELEKLQCLPHGEMMILYDKLNSTFYDTNVFLCRYRYS